MLLKHMKKIVGASAAVAIAITVLIQPWEGRIYKAEKDVGGVWGVCDGHTGSDIDLNKIYTDTECDHFTARDARIAEIAVDTHVKFPITDYTKAALISFVYNVGEGNFKKSTLLKRLNSGDVAGACGQLSDWVHVNGYVIRGLQNRRYLGDGKRMSERALCLMGVVK